MEPKYHVKVKKLHLIFCRLQKRVRFYVEILRRVCPKLYGNYAIPQNFHTMKLGEIAVFYIVSVEELVLTKRVITERIGWVSVKISSIIVSNDSSIKNWFFIRE